MHRRLSLQIDSNEEEVVMINHLSKRCSTGFGQLCLNDKIIKHLEFINECELSKHYRKYPLPPLNTTFPYKRNPLDKRPEIRRWLQWNLESSVMSKEKFAKFEGTTIFTAYFYPFCSSIDRYENLVKYMVQFFVFDDHTEADWGDVARNMDEANKIWGQFDQMLDKLVSDRNIPMNGWKPYVLAMYSVFENIFDQFNDTQKTRSVDAWKSYMQGNLEETQAINSGLQFTDIEQMIKIRRKSIGFKPAVQFIEYADQLFLPEEDWNDPKMSRLFDLMSDIFIYVNDFFSFEKEIIQQKGDLSKMFNLVALISRLDHCTIGQAMQRLTDMIMENEQKIRNAENDILNDSQCTEVKRTFIKRMNYFVGGNHKVSTVLDRYNKIDWSQQY